MYDVYTTKRLQYLIQEVDAPSSFLRDRYFPCNESTDIFSTEKILVEVKGAEGRMAPFTSSRGNGVAMSRNGQTMIEYTAPTVAPMRPLTIDDLKKRGFGEALYTELTEEQRALTIATNDMAELSDMITRREEWMAAQTLLTNGCVMYAYTDNMEKGEEDEVRFYGGGTNPAQHGITIPWDQPNANIYGDLWDMIQKLTQRGLPATDFVCSPDVAAAIVNNEYIQKVLDNRRYELGNVAPTLMDPSAGLMCVLNVYGYPINIIAYSKQYTDDEGKTQLYIPSGKGVLTAPNCGHAVYGAVTQMEQADGEFHTYPGRRVPKYLANAHDNVRTLTITSRPLMMPAAVDPYIAVDALS